MGSALFGADKSLPFQTWIRAGLMYEPKPVPFKSES